MGQQARYDVTGTVHLADPKAVETAVLDLLTHRFTAVDVALISRAFQTFSALFAGLLPGFKGCDTWYHDAQHSLDATLAFARLLDGYEQSVPPAEQLGTERAMLGVIIALFHDAGYVRSDRDVGHRNGAEFTLCHVARSGAFISDFLKGTQLEKYADVSRQIVHFTGYEIALDKIRVSDPRDRHLGYFLGTVDLLAQMADACYLEKCWHHLYREFSICGLAGDAQPGRPKPVYSSAEDLMRKTPDFNRMVWKDRLDGYFEGCYRYLNAHFNGDNPYVNAIDEHVARLDHLLADDALHELRHEPEVIGAAQLRSSLNSFPAA